MTQLLKSIYNKIIELERRIRVNEAKDKAFQKKILEYLESDEYKSVKESLKNRTK